MRCQRLRVTPLPTKQATTLTIFLLRCLDLFLFMRACASGSSLGSMCVLRQPAALKPVCLGCTCQEQLGTRQQTALDATLMATIVKSCVGEDCQPTIPCQARYARTISRKALHLFAF